MTTMRMLLSHNFNLFDPVFPELTREEFAEVFITGFKDNNNIQCKLIDNPHWIVEIIFSLTEFTPKTIGQMCGDILETKRKEQTTDNSKLPDILILGGKKITPSIANSPTSLQTGEWGVDIVETASAEKFLVTIDWSGMTDNKPVEDIFKIEKLNR